MKTLIKNIKQIIGVQKEGVSVLKGVEMKSLNPIDNGYLLIENDVISDFGNMDNLPQLQVDNEIDAQGRFLMPAWVDSHTHIVYAGTREDEFVDKINGLSYEEIAARGGGIINSAAKLQNASEDELFESASNRLDSLIKLGTGAIEIKSGYGLTVEAEMKMLRVIKRLKEHFSIPIKSTFLGAHAYPTLYKDNKRGYIDLILSEMIPKIAKEGLADYIDVFCEENYFSVDEMNEILEEGIKFGLTPKVHVNQFTSIGAIKACVERGALSVDHLEVMSEDDFKALKDSSTMPVILPACSFFIKIPYGPGRKMIDMGLPVALASDFNPGSSPTGNMNFVTALGCLKMGLLPEEAINASTMNGAYAMDISSTHGSITKGKKANLILTKKIPSYNFIPYEFASNHIETVFIDGKVYN